MIKGKLTLLSAIMMFLLGNCAYAQYGHYWSENYGNKSMLLSGTVNASVEDLGAVFYNPGRLGQIENPAFVISAQVYEWNTVKIEDGINEGIDMTKSNFGGAPSLVAGTFGLPFLKNHKFAYSFLTRQRAQSDFFVRVEEEGDVIDNVPGNVVFNGKLNLISNSREEWMGLTWSYPVSEKFSVGLSNYLSFLNKSSAVELNMNALDDNNQVTSLTLNSQYNYNISGLVWKMGAAWDLKPIRLGATITTPKVNLSNNGSFLYENYLVGVDTTGDGSKNDVFVFNYQDNLKTKYSSPWAIGIGVGIHLKKVVIHLSAEWYDKVSQFTIFEVDPFVGQSTGETLGFRLVEELDPVLNYGIGIEYHLSEKTAFYASFATDFSGVPSDVTRFAEFEEEASNSTFRTNFYRFGGGLSLNTKWAEITVGASYSGSSQQFDRPIDFPDEGNEPIFDSGEKSTIKFNQWRFILGFSFPFAEKVKEDLNLY